MPEFSRLRDDPAGAEFPSRLLKSVTDNASVALFIMDERQHCIFMNPAAEQLTGFRREDVRGRPLHDVVHHTHPDGTPYPLDDCPIDRAFPEKNQVRGEEVFVHRDGHFYDVEFTASPIRNEAGAPVGTIVEVQDISERKRNERAMREAEARLRASEERLRATFDNAAVGIAHVAPDGRWLRVNDRLRDIVGYAGDDLLSRTFQDITHPDDLQADLHLMHELLAGTRDSYSMDKRYIRKDGTTVWVTLTGSLVRSADGTPAYFIAVVQDISDRKRAEAALQEADRRKDEFLAILAHELRNPLAPIRTATALLNGNAISEQMIRRSRTVIDRQVTHMSRLLDDLLDVSRLSSGRFELRLSPVPLREAIDAAIETARPLLDQRHQQLTLAGADEPVVLTADAARLTQVFGNLLTNASLYSDEGSAIEVIVESRNSAVTITVRDHGIGIAPDMLGRVFESFHRSESARRLAPGGIGIGLSLARTLVEMHGGSIAARSDGPGLGSAFVVTLPVMGHAEATHDPTVTTSADARPGRRLRVLVVDDNADAADMMALLLQSTAEVHAAYSGEGAIREAERLRPDVILLDIGLPDLDGYEVCRRLRAQPWGREAAIIALTGWGQAQDRQRSAASGFDQHLVKPADPEQVLAIVREASKGRAARQ